jgi:hypothetical protein
MWNESLFDIINDMVCSKYRRSSSPISKTKISRSNYGNTYNKTDHVSVVKRRHSSIILVRKLRKPRPKSEDNIKVDLKEILYEGMDWIRRSQWPCGLRRASWPVGCWDRGFESQQGMDVCPRLSMLCCPV